jgi:Tfp pilus assembly protein PilF
MEKIKARDMQLAEGQMLDVMQVIAALQRAIDAMGNGDSRAAEDEVRDALQQVASFNHGRRQAVYYCTPPLKD